MKLNWKWILGIVVILAVIALPVAGRFFMPYSGGFGMMRGNGYGMHMPMAVYGYGMIAPFGMWLMWLLPLTAFILIGFAFGWAVNRFTNKSS